MNYRKLETLLLIILVVLISGCASGLNVTYHSDPAGATLYAGNQRFGYTPQTLRYQISEEDQKRGYVILQGASVRWASGVSANITSLRADLRNGFNQQFMFNRPADYPGYEVDARFALELEKLKVMRQQADAQYRQAQAQEDQAYQQQLQQNKRCISTRVGNIIYTKCD